MFKTALHERTKKWALKKQSAIGEDKDTVLHIHEAYQYLLRKCVDDVARNTIANELAEKLSIGKKHALKKYDQYSLNTSYICGSTGSNITPVVKLNEFFVIKIMNKLIHYYC